MDRRDHRRLLGAPTENKWQTIGPAEKVPPFTEDLVNNAFDQDDLYVEMTFLRTLEQFGFDVPILQAGIDSRTVNTGSGSPTPPAAPTSARASRRPTPAIPSFTVAPAPSTTRSKRITPADRARLLNVPSRWARSSAG